MKFVQIGRHVVNLAQLSHIEIRGEVEGGTIEAHLQQGAMLELIGPDAEALLKHVGATRSSVH